ncbi:serine/threonine-protein kinase-like protein CCR1 [Tasmannia lanceolata]|uniref:serine/threonine-protein kinase-like protein CCR1 n=1 Tax=Tasmannia lanceolata TaxID=3420 RepID=UPI0040628A56
MPYKIKLGFPKLSPIQPLHLLLLMLSLFLILLPASGFGSMGPISAAFGLNGGFFCAIEASGKQEIVCWEKNGSSPLFAAYFSSLPPMAALSGGEGFMCGLHALTSQPYCWKSRNSGKDFVPFRFKNYAYSHIAAGKDHVCAVRGSYCYAKSDSGFGNIDCWIISENANGSSSNSNLNSSSVSVFDSGFSVYDPPSKNLSFGEIVSGEGFTCGESMQLGFICWGPNSMDLGVFEVSDSFVSLASGRDFVCGISSLSGEVNCWGDIEHLPLVGTRFIGLSAGSRHFCGIREDDHGIECWGSFNSSLIPKGSGFLAISSSDFTTCGVREDDLILDCWGSDGLFSSSLDYSPPLQLCSPGLCTVERCNKGVFWFNASVLNVPDLASLCVRKDLRICSPCGLNCSEGFFPSSVCGEYANRVCTACSLCQNSTCSDACRLSSSVDSMELKERQWVKKLSIILGVSISGCLALALTVWCVLPRVIMARKGRKGVGHCASCIGNMETEPDNNAELQFPHCTAPNVATQAFRLSELKDATNGFKEFNELGRGSYGFVYKAVLSDGRQVAVKRANAAKRIHSNSRDFEAELEILCKIRHCNLVNLLGYCAEMGERLLVYEFMPHGTLHDHLHGGLSPVNWNLRLKISLQAARGLEYLHKNAAPPIVHRGIKTSNILLDSEWGARIADVGLLGSADRAIDGDSVYVDPDYYKTQAFTEKSDVYSFGVVLLEILSGRKAYDKDYTPPSIVEWAVPLIRRGKAAVIIDRNVSLPGNVEPLLGLAEIAELAVRDNPCERPIMSNVAVWLEQIVKGGFSF